LSNLADFLLLFCEKQKCKTSIQKSKTNMSVLTEAQHLEVNEIIRYNHSIRPTHSILPHILRYIIIVANGHPSDK
jgi:hypothetical protein